MTGCCALPLNENYEPTSIHHPALKKPTHNISLIAKKGTNILYTKNGSVPLYTVRSMLMQGSIFVQASYKNSWTEITSLPVNVQMEHDYQSLSQFYGLIKLERPTV